MADTRVQTAVEDWVRREWMPKKFGHKFYRERLQLSSGGVFDFDAVSDDHNIVASISTSSGKTASGKLGVGKLHKLRADILFLTLAEAERRVMVLTEADMFELCLKELQGGRVPKSIEFISVPVEDLPVGLATQLSKAREAASKEVSPSRKG
jgi:hypothetical protein